VALADPGATAATLRSTCQDVLTTNQKQERLIEALLTLALSQRGLEHHQLFDLAHITARVLEVRRPQARARGLSIEATLNPAPATGDPDLAERMVANLTDNALRYNTPGGQITVTTATSDGQSILQVTNTGHPVSASQIQRLLQPFQRLNPDRAGEPSGSGLGLSIAAAIAEAHRAAFSARPGPRGGLAIEIAFTSPANGDHSPVRNSQHVSAHRA